MPDGDAEVPAGERLPARLWRRVREPDAYGVVLLAVLASLVATGIGGPARVVAALLSGGALLFAGYTAGHRRFVLRCLAPLAVLAVAASLLSTVLDARWLVVLGHATAVLLVTATIVVVLTRIGRHVTITLATISGALSAYLLIGIGYAEAYALLGDGALVVNRQLGPVDDLYFSLATVTTVGYGDVVAGTTAVRMLAVSEALIGQLYLVTVVALAVANLGQRRRPRRGEREP